MSYRNYKGFKQ